MRDDVTTRAPHAGETIRVALGTRSYDIIIGEHLLDAAGGFIASTLPGARSAVVAPEPCLHEEGQGRIMRGRAGQVVRRKAAVAHLAGVKRRPAGLASHRGLVPGKVLALLEPALAFALVDLLHGGQALRRREGRQALGGQTLADTVPRCRTNVAPHAPVDGERRQPSRAARDSSRRKFAPSRAAAPAGRSTPSPGWC